MNMEAFDPLTLLEAEYAAVLAQSRPSKHEDGDYEDAQPHEDDRAGSGGEQPRGSASNNRSDDDESDADEEDDGDANAMYSLLPSSPGGGGLRGFDSEEEGEEEDEAAKEGEVQGRGTDRAPPLGKQQMSADKRQTIMQIMQKLQLQAPAWAAASRVSDEQLVALVQRQLESKE